jgi:hypothetical protein
MSKSCLNTHFILFSYIININFSHFWVAIFMNVNYTDHWFWSVMLTLDFSVAELQVWKWLLLFDTPIFSSYIHFSYFWMSIFMNVNFINFRNCRVILTLDFLPCSLSHIDELQASWWLHNIDIYWTLILHKLICNNDGVSFFSVFVSPIVNHF